MKKVTIRSGPAVVKLRGAGHKYVELLHESGHKHVDQLCQADPKSLGHTLRAVNARRSIVQRLPNERMISQWIRQAQAAQKGLIVAESEEGPPDKPTKPSKKPDEKPDERLPPDELRKGRLPGKPRKPPKP